MRHDSPRPRWLDRPQHPRAPIRSALLAIALGVIAGLILTGGM